MNKNLKIALVFLIAFIIGITITVGAATVFNSKDITYSSDKTTKTNVKESLDELYTNLGKCPKGQYCYTSPKPISVVELGDYIKMTPTSTFYTISKDLTGYSSDQTIGLKELNLWRVISKNDDLTIEVVSEFVGMPVAFNQKIGYLKLVGSLNTIAAQYTDDVHILRARHMGYSNQTEFCINFSISDCPGDSAYETDIERVKSAIGSLVSTRLNGSPSSYWLASRQYWKEENRNVYAGRMISRDGELSTCSAVRIDNDGNVINGIGECGIRPIITLKSNIKIKSGDGKSAETAYALE